MPIERIVDDGAEMVLDDRLAPILIATWFGTATGKTIDGFRDWVEAQIVAAQARNEVLALINDSLDADRPSPAARTKFSALTFDPTVVIALPTVITNPMVRGVMTAVGWVIGERMKAVTTWATLPEAFESARTALREAGARPPPPSRINGYQRPKRGSLES